MKYLAAYLLLQNGGNASPSASDIKELLGAVGIDSEDDRANQVVSELEGKDINQLISEGSNKLASVPSGGAGASSGGASAPAAAAGGDAAPAAEKAEEAKEESDDDMGFGLFD